MVLLLSAFAQISSAATRVKTVEWNFGSYYSTTDATTWTPPYITINLPDAVQASPIKDAHLEVEYLTTGGADTTNINILFNTGSSPSTTVDTITGSYVPANSGENDIMVVRADVTSQVTAWANQNYAMRFTVTGPASNMFSAKLYITYYYDDTAATQVKTVHFPLLSSSADGISGVASTLAQRSSASPTTFYYLVETPETGVLETDALEIDHGPEDDLDP
jgi:hypothetical protein